MEMNEFKYLFKLENGKWVNKAWTTNANFIINSPGTYRINWKINNMWQTPSDPVTFTLDEIENSFKCHDFRDKCQL
jgi:hypothetical protein